MNRDFYLPPLVFLGTCLSLSGVFYGQSTILGILHTADARAYQCSLLFAFLTAPLFIATGWTGAQGRTWRAFTAGCEGAIFGGALAIFVSLARPTPPPQGLLLALVCFGIGAGVGGHKS